MNTFRINDLPNKINTKELLAELVSLAGEGTSISYVEGGSLTKRFSERSGAKVEVQDIAAHIEVIVPDGVTEQQVAKVVADHKPEMDDAAEMKKIEQGLFTQRVAEALVDLGIKVPGRKK